MLGFVIVWLGARKLVNWLRDGDLFCFYLIWYPVGPLLGRDVPTGCLAHGHFATAQWVAIFCLSSAWQG